ncbi:MAG: cytochrome c3 family protein [Bacteroidales bacterium]|nr:cytochrome c3 family protein [Bacteroidales bacterium]
MLLFVVFIGVFLIIRSILVPDTFGQYGHYRGESLEDNASEKLVFAEAEDCKACHDDILGKLQNEMHSGLSCLICHGPGRAHVEDPQLGNITKESGREFCGRCHNYHPAKSTDVIFQVDILTHHTEKTDCIECHNPHSLWEGME